MDAKGITATVVGTFALGGFGFLAIHMTRNVAAEQLQWDRLVYVFGGVEAVAFGAAAQRHLGGVCEVESGQSLCL
jgi:hypothetical protein